MAAIAALATGLSAASVYRAVEPLEAPGHGPLHVVDRKGRLLRVLPARAGHRGRGQWLPLAQIPPILQRLVLVSEDQRFYSHAGVDPWAIGRALVDNLQARGVTSGASTLSMQLMRMLHHPRAERGLANKLAEAWLALAAEQRLSKDEILEAYLNHAYYGHGAYGVREAAHRYFNKPPHAMNDAEASLLAVLPRAPSAYDPIRRLDAARKRRHTLLSRLVSRGELAAEEQIVIETTPLFVSQKARPVAYEAPHFVDWVLGSLPDATRTEQGTLVTTLDLSLQRELEHAVRTHVGSLAGKGVQEAAVVVLETRTTEVLAMVGSTAYAKSHINMVTRRRQPGSLLKPFVYALALERGRPASSLVYDVGDVPSAFRNRDWVGREGGPLPMPEALAGSYNLAAVHLLEQVGVQPLMHRLRSLGVAQLSLPPAHYGLELALGSAKVRLLDATTGFGFLVRDGRVRRASGWRELRRIGPGRAANLVLTPPRRQELPGFSPEISWLVMQMLSSPGARQRRFGYGLPIEGSTPDPRAAHVAAKTGTASGMSDVTSVLVSREFLVGAWTGRLDGRPTRGLSGMWAAAPLARRALDIALKGRHPSLLERPEGVVSEQVCAVSGMRATDACPERRSAYTLREHAPSHACTWHRRNNQGVQLHVPPELSSWLSRARVQASPRRSERPE